MANTYLLLLAFATFFCCTEVNAQISRKVRCEEGPLDVIFLVDTNARNASDFEKQQTKIAEIIRHLESISTARDTLYSVIGFHRRPVILLSIVSPFAAKPAKVVESVKSLSARSKFDSSPAKALDLAAQQFINYGRPKSDKLVILAHDGISTDLIAETLEARNSLQRIQATVFAITSTDKPNLAALTGYTLDRSHVYTTRADREVFFEEMERAIGACAHFSEVYNDKRRFRLAALGVRTHETASAQESEKSSFDGECKANKIDLMVVLDTSGSVFHAFAEERKLAKDLIESLDPDTFEDGRLQVSLVRFSSSASIKVPFKIGRPREEVLERLNEIEFTGSDTRIARAVDLALAELSRARRRDAIQVFILITDGYGQEFWHVVQMAGKKLQNADAEVYAVSTSRDYNLAELTLYTGDANRVYVGPQHHQFIRTVTPLISKCLRSSLSQSHATQPSTISPEPKVLEIDSTASMKSTAEKSLLTTATVASKTTETEHKTTIGAENLSTVDIFAREVKKPGDTLKSTVAKDGRKQTLSTIPVDETSGSTIPENATFVPDLSNIVEEAQNDNDKSTTPKNTTTEKLYEEVTPAINPDLVALADSFEELDSSAEPQNVTVQIRVPLKAKGSPSLTKNQLKVKLDDDQEKKLTLNKPVVEEEDEEKDGGASDLKITKLPPRRPTGGHLDLLFAIDRSPDLPVDLTNQLKLAAELVDELTDEDINDERVRIAIVSFANDTRMDLEWGNATSKADIFKRLSSIEYTGGDTSAVTGIKLATQYAQMARRPKTRLMIILISNGNSRDLWHSVIQTAKKLHELPNTIIYAVTTSKQYTFIELEAFAGDKWRVYVDGRIRRFVADAGKLLIDGTDEVIVTDDANVPTSTTQKTSASRRNDLVDLIILLDKSTKADDDFDASKEVLEELIRSAPATDYKSRIRVGLITFADRAHTDIELKKPSTRDDILYALDRTQNTGGETSIPAGLNTALSQISNTRRSAAVRLIFVIVTDGGSRDSVDIINVTATKLQETGAEVYMLPISDKYAKDELLLYCLDESQLISNARGHAEKLVNYVRLNSNKPAKKDFVKTTENDLFVEKVTVPTLSDDRSDPRNKPDLGIEAAAENELNTALSDFDFGFPATGSKELPANPNCEVDLMFIIDKSQSVEKEFQKQLQFAVALIKRIPPSDFETRVRVAAVSFNFRAQIEFRFDEYNNQTKILEALLAIKHTGGSTSAVSGVNLAVGEIQKTGRKGVRKMIVLISDGNSQDRWEELLAAADRLRATDANVYAVTASHDYYFRELELYAGSKWLVYIDARRRQFLDDAELSIVQCQSPSAPISSPPPREEHVTAPSPSAAANELVLGKVSEGQETSTSPAICNNDLVDLLFVIDTSKSVENDFYKEKAFALDLIKVLPLEDFENRIAVAVVQFSDTGKVKVGFGKRRTRGDILYELERIERTGGRTSIVAGADAALLEVATSRRSGARLIIIIISDGNSQDLWELVQNSAKKLRKTGGEIYAVTLSKEYNLPELKEYTGKTERVYVGDRINHFIEDVGVAVLNCNSSTSSRKVPVTLAPFEMIHVTLPPENVSPAAGAARSKLGGTKAEEEKGPFGGERGAAATKILTSNELARDERPVDPARDSKPLESTRCKYSKMDLEIILDASTSRQQVFEHQRELALSLIERLPIDAGETHVAVGINSFTSVPTLRQTLGLGRDKQMVRHAIEDIKYNGGSTFTAQAVELSVEDLQRGRRPDAIQVVVLMNDGMSQDPWERVLQASELLQSTGAELFGVALGDRIDLRELRHYIGSDERIYRDNSTERFLTDVVSLLTGGEKCGIPIPSKKLVDTKAQVSGTTDEICNTPNLDLVIVFDNADETGNLSDPSISSNRYLLLDVLGSLPAMKDDERVKISIITLSNEPQLIVGLSDEQDKDYIFNKVEGIEAAAGNPSYAKAVDFALQEYDKDHRSDARGLLVIVGDGRSEDNESERKTTAQHVQNIPGLAVYAVDSGKSVDVAKLSEYTGSAENVFNYDRNAEFAKAVFNAATAADKAQCPQTSHAGRFAEVSSASLRTQQNIQQRRQQQQQQQLQRRKDVGNKLDFDLKEFEGQKVVVKEKTSTTAKVRTPRPTTTGTTTKPPVRTTDARKEATEAKKTGKPKIAVTERNDNETVATTATSKLRVTSSRPALSTRETTPTRPSIQRQTEATTTVPRTTTVFAPGCEIDAIIIIDSSGSVEETFGREKELAAGIIQRLRVGPNNARIAIIKFAAKEKVKTVWSFDQPQVQEKVLQALEEIPFSSGTTAIHTALLQAITEYSSTKGARPGQATPFGIIFTDGFGQKDTTEAATLLRSLIPNMYAVAINRQYPISQAELERIAGSKDRVFTDENIDKLYEVLEKITKTC